MSMLQSVVEWAENDLPKWQSDAVRRMLTQNDVTEADKLELLAMLKDRHGLGNPESPASKPQPVMKGLISGVPQTASRVTIKAMRVDSNVNAIPDGSELPFGHQGLTVIYGENGSGKSGYARVLKRACSARDAEENILPNAFAKAAPGPAKACFKVSINSGPDTDIHWEDGQQINATLSNICVFDSKCARVIVNENNDITYLPYGAHVFEVLVALLKDFRVRLENAKPKPKKPDYSDIPVASEAGRFMAGLSFKTTSDDIKKATRWLDTDATALKDLAKRIVEAEAHDPRQQAQRIRNMKSRVDKLLDAVVSIDVGLSESRVKELSKACQNLVASQEALAIASQETLADEPLPGAGKDAWQRLYNAAKLYSIEKAYPGREFPVAQGDSRCVLCMQPLLEDAKKRMLRFRDFMERTTKKAVESAAAILETHKKSIQEITIPSSDLYKDAIDEIRNRAPSIADQLIGYLDRASGRAASMIKAETAEALQTLPELSSPSCECLAQIAGRLEIEAQEIEKAADPETLGKLRAQRDELAARRLLSQKTKEIRGYLEQLGIAQKYEACIAETDYRNITLKGKEMLTETLTPELQKALANELRALNVSHLPLDLKATGSEGETLHRMELVGCRLPKKATLTDILSEGEQHVIAIAGFMAELQVGNTKSPIVFDDPVCSLDHLYRETIAKRLVAEAAVRQVLIFTHDIAFLLELRSKAGELEGTWFLSQTVLKFDNKPGKCVDGVPWHAMAVKERIAYLDKLLSGLRNLHNKNTKEYNRQAADLYGLLRETWEAVIEEVLFYGTLMRHSGEVQTLKLRYVTVTDDDYRTIHLGMTKCSKWMLGHDKSKALDANRPSPDEVQQDIASVREFSKSVRTRAEQVGKKRMESLEPKTPPAG
jgi:energy-coupling factor transporter ATP-binding protein EcfA2